MLGTLARVGRDEGYLALWKGLGPGEGFGGLAPLAILPSAQLLGETLAAAWLSPVTAGGYRQLCLSSSLAVNPLELKALHQHPRLTQRPCAVALPAGLQRQVVYGGLRVGLYEPVKEEMNRLLPGSDETLAAKVAAALATSSFAICVASPTDLVKASCSWLGSLP